MDNELQDLMPGVLKLLLTTIWAERQDWFWGTDMGIYFDPDDEPVVPDGFLVLGVPRIKDENLRRSYVLWEEKAVPVLTLEVVSRKRCNEHRQKKLDYTALGVRYYIFTMHCDRLKRALKSTVWSKGSIVFCPTIQSGCLTLVWPSAVNGGCTRASNGNGSTGMTRGDSVI